METKPPAAVEAVAEAYNVFTQSSEVRHVPITLLQEWVTTLPLMQQTVLLTAIRGPDNTPKYTPAKMLLRWFRRCVLVSAMDQRVITTPYDRDGGSFTGPSISMPTVIHQLDAAIVGSGGEAGSQINWEGPMADVVADFLRSMDALPLHFVNHFRHAVEIVGYKHSDDRIRAWWHQLYLTMVNDLHLHPESMEEMDKRLSDNREAWLARNNVATVE